MENIQYEVTPTTTVVDPKGSGNTMSYLISMPLPVGTKLYGVDVINQYEALLEEHRAFVRELDVLLNGANGAAKQASICDIVSQVKLTGIKIKMENRVGFIPHSQD